MKRAFPRLAAGIIALIAMMAGVKAAYALDASEIALVINKRVPAGEELAKVYAAARHIPDGRIIELDIDPVTPLYPAEEIPFDRYEADVVKPVRKFLIDHQLRAQVKCLVTFYGLPFRIGRRLLTPIEQAEAAQLPSELRRIDEAVSAQVALIEAVAQAQNPDFKPATGSEPQMLAARVEAAMKLELQSLANGYDDATQHQDAEKIAEAVRKLDGPIQSVILLSRPELTRVLEHPPTPEQLQAARQQIAISLRQLASLRADASTSSARADVRKFAGERFGLLNEALITKNQIDGLNVSESESALDNELAALWWIDYPRTRWVANPLNWRIGSINSPAGGPTLMVMRLDGPTPMTVRNIIDRSLEIEQKGLTGIAVIDARGKPASEPYGQYDQKLRDLAELLKTKTKMQVVLDNEPDVIRYHSVHEPIAIYCGWYSLRHYQPPGEFTPGAVAFHVASFEMISLRARGEKGWVRGLLQDGVGATLGPVAEPYLQSFPAADEFFPLLLTGKLTLAEVYWRTTPMVSWMQCCVGDPLYTPYLHNPQLSMSDLPDGLTRVAK